MSAHEHHGMKPLQGIAKFCRLGHEDAGHQREDRFGRMFPRLAPAYTPPHLLQEVGRRNGPMDGKSASDRTDSVSVGMVFFGQFVDHDITLDASTSFNTVVIPTRAEGDSRQGFPRG